MTGIILSLMLLIGIGVLLAIAIQVRTLWCTMSSYLRSQHPPDNELPY